MAGAVKAAPKQRGDSGPNAVNPGVSGAAPLINEAGFLRFRSCEAIPKRAGSASFGEDIRSSDACFRMRPSAFMEAAASAKIGNLAEF